MIRTFSSNPTTNIRLKLWTIPTTTTTVVWSSVSEWPTEERFDRANPRLICRLISPGPGSTAVQLIYGAWAPAARGGLGASLLSVPSMEAAHHRRTWRQSTRMSSSVGRSTWRNPDRRTDRRTQLASIVQLEDCSLFVGSPTKYSRR